MDLKHDHNYYYQIQGQMYLTKRQFCYFMVFTEKWSIIQIIQYDETFWTEKIVKKLEM